MVKVYAFFCFILTCKITSTMSCSTIYVGFENKSKDADSCSVSNITESLKILNDIPDFTMIKIFSTGTQKIHDINEEIIIGNLNTTIVYLYIIISL